MYLGTRRKKSQGSEQRRTVATIEHDGDLISLVVVDGKLRLEVEGVDVGAVRGVKRLTGPDLGSAATTKHLYQALAREPSYRAHLLKK